MQDQQIKGLVKVAVIIDCNFYKQSYNVDSDNSKFIE